MGNKWSESLDIIDLNEGWRFVQPNFEGTMDYAISLGNLFTLQMRKLVNGANQMEHESNIINQERITVLPDLSEALRTQQTIISTQQKSREALESFFETHSEVLDAIRQNKDGDIDVLSIESGRLWGSYPADVLREVLQEAGISVVQEQAGGRNRFNNHYFLLSGRQELEEKRRGWMERFFDSIHPY